MNIDDMKLRTKLLVPLTTMALVAMGMVVFGISQLSSISRAAGDIIERRDVGATYMQRASQAMLEVPYSVLGILAFDPDSPEGKAANATFPKAMAEAAQFVEEARARLPEKSDQIEGFAKRFQAIAAGTKAPMEIANELPPLTAGRQITPEILDKFAQTATLMINVDLDTRSLRADIASFNAKLLGENAAAAADLRSQSLNTTILMVVVGLTATLLSGALAVWMSAVKIAGPLSLLNGKMVELANGNLKVEIDGVDRGDEVGDMARATLTFKEALINNKRMEQDADTARRQAELDRIADQEKAEADAAERMRVATSGIADGLNRLAAGDVSFQLNEAFSEDFEKLRKDFNASILQLSDTLQSVAGSVVNITSGSHEISVGADDLSKRTEQQASALEETAAALDEISANVTSSSKRAQDARNVAVQANQSASKSVEVVARAVEAMGRIEASSRQMSSIMGVIDDFALQTNLLALNAGVEAARAGEAGRGFAVVAQEVRQLAQRCAEASREIKTLIDASSAEVASGVKLVSDTGEALQAISSHIASINDHMEAIATASREQATGLGEVNTALNQIDHSTQQNAAMVEQTSAAAAQLANEASALRQLISHFELGQAGQRDLALREAAKRLGTGGTKRPAPKWTSSTDQAA